METYASNTKEMYKGCKGCAYLGYQCEYGLNKAYMEAGDTREYVNPHPDCWERD